MRRTLLLLCAAMLSAAAAVGASRLLWPKRAAVVAPVARVGLQVAPNQLDFGEVWQTDRFVWRVCVCTTRGRRPPV